MSQIIIVAKKEWAPPKESEIGEELLNDHRIHIGLIMSQVVVDPETGQPVPNPTMTERRRALSDQEAKTKIAPLAAGQGADAESVMSGNNVEYWDYVSVYDPEYYKAVKEKADAEIPRILKWVEKEIPPGSVPPKPEEGGGGAPPGPGAPPPPPPPGPAASSKRMTKHAMYLVRRDGKSYRLKGTLGNEIVLGKFKYPATDGSMRRIMLSDRGDIAVPRSSASVKAIRLMEPLEKIISGQIAHSLRGRVNDPEDVANAVVARAKARGKFDALPVAYATMGPTRAMALLRNAEDAPEDIKRVIGLIARAMSPYVNALKDGLTSDGIGFSELSSLDRNGHDVAPAVRRNPSLLHQNQIGESSDVKSLVMTMMGEPSLGPMASDRLRTLISRHPQLLEEEGFSEDDLRAMGSSEDGAGVSRLARLHGADDAEVMEAYYGNPEDADLLVNLIAAQGRDSIIKAIPELCFRESGMNIPYFARIDPSDVNGRAAVMRACGMRDEGHRFPDDLLDRKAMSAMLSGGDSDMASGLLSGSSPALSRFALSWLAENGGDVSEAMSSLSPMDGDESALASLALSSGGNDIMRMAKERLGASPMGMSLVGGRKSVIPYLKSNRMDWSGTAVPRASEIFSAPENAISLANNLLSIEDKDGLLVLLRKCADNAHSKKKNKAFREMTNVVWKALQGLGAEDEAASILRSVGLSFDGDRLKGTSVPDEPTPDDVRASIRNGDDVGAAIMLDMVAAGDPETASAILRTLPAPGNPDVFVALLLPEILENTELPEWASAKLVTSEFLPNGMVLSGTPSSYSVEGEDAPCFACQSSERVVLAIKVAGKRP